MAFDTKLANYPIYFGRLGESLEDWFSERKDDYSSIHILVDENTRTHCLAHIELSTLPVRPNIIELTAGEQFKNINSCQAIWSALLDAKADRHALFINLGGGVIGDMGGFAASCYKRGIHFIQIPTSLLAQVDASVGGKLGIDYGGLKNSIGLFQEPQAVFIDTDFLQTLPKRELISGLGEVLKHALIGSADYLQLLLESPLEELDWQPIVERSVQIKAAVVRKDPTEQADRKQLNFGHTIGHALESWSLEEGRETLLHGEAIAIGMVCSLQLSVELCGLDKAVLKEAESYIRKHFSQANIPENELDDILKYTTNDKKNKGRALQMSLLKAVGEPIWGVNCSQQQLKDSLLYYIRG